jgi:DnaK suppressor protein
MSSDTAIRRRTTSSPFAPHELARFRRLLIQQRDALKRSSEGLSEAACRTPGDSSGQLSSFPSDSGDLASDTFEQDLSIEFLGRVQTEMRILAEALDRIEAGTYGVCEGCGDGISALRLEALPTARCCIVCQSRIEA